MFLLLRELSERAVKVFFCCCNFSFLFHIRSKALNSRLKKEKQGKFGRRDGGWKKNCAASASSYNDIVGSFFWKLSHSIQMNFHRIFSHRHEFLGNPGSFQKKESESLPESHRQLPFCSSVGVKVLGRSVRLEK